MQTLSFGVNKKVSFFFYSGINMLHEYSKEKNYEQNANKTTNDISLTIKLANKSG